MLDHWVCGLGYSYDRFLEYNCEVQGNYDSRQKAPDTSQSSIANEHSGGGCSPISIARFNHTYWASKDTHFVFLTWQGADGSA